MVAETKETFTKMFDNMNEGFRAAWDAGRRTQESFFKNAGETAKFPTGFEPFFTFGERFAREFVPFVGRGFETVAQSFDTGLRANMDVLKAACESSTKPEDGDFYKKSRRVLDAAFDAARTNFDTFSKAGSRAVDNYTTFVQTTCCDESCGKPAAKTTPKTSA